MGAAGGVVIVRIMREEKTPGMVIFHLGMNVAVEERASSNLE